MIITIAQKYNVKCVGVEMDPLKCWWVNLMIRQKKLKGRVRVIHSNFLEVNLEDAENVFVFLSEQHRHHEKTEGENVSRDEAGAHGSILRAPIQRLDAGQRQKENCFSIRFRNAQKSEDSS